MKAAIILGHARLGYSTLKQIYTLVKKACKMYAPVTVNFHQPNQIK